MTGPSVLDASAVLALLHREPGWDIVATVIGDAQMSTVNLAEVIQKAGQHGIEVDGLAGELADLGLQPVPFELPEAEAAARLWLTGFRSLSFGDRACIATAQLRGAPVITADRGWSELGLPATVQLVR